MLYIAHFEDGTKGQVVASGYATAWNLVRHEYRKSTANLRLGGLRDLAYRSAEQSAPARCAVRPATTLRGRVYREIAQAA